MKSEDFSMLSDEELLSLYEKILKKHIAFCAAKSEAQKFLKDNYLDVEVVSGYEYILSILENIISKRNLTVPEEWSKYPRFADVNMVAMVLESEKVRRLSMVKSIDESLAEERKKQINFDFEQIIDSALFEMLDEANLDDGKMSSAEQIVQSLLEKHGYTDKIRLWKLFNDRYWDISMALKERGYIIVDRPVINPEVNLSDIAYAFAVAKEMVLSKADSKEIGAIENVFTLARNDTTTIELLLSKLKNNKAVLN